MEESTSNHLVSCVCVVFVHLANNISAIVAERDSWNDLGKELPTVLPHQLVASDMCALVRELDVHNTRLKRCFSNYEIQKIDQDYAHMLRAVRMELELNASLNAMTNTATSFEDAWSVFGYRFQTLKEFCNGSATVISNTATVDSDFYRLGLKKNKYRKSLTDFSLEGLLHSKQYFNLFDQ